MNKEIEPNSIYTTGEIKIFLKISDSTMKRLLKKGIIKANKIGSQYRILGKEILRLILPKTEKKAADFYQKVKKRTKDKINKW